MKIKNKRAMEGGMWWIIIGAIVAVVVAGIILFIVKGGLSAGKDNIDILAHCKSQGGRCVDEDKDSEGKSKSPCPNEASYYKFSGCSATQYCCIPK